MRQDQSLIINMATYLTTTFITLATVVSMAMAYTGKVLIVSFDGFRWDYLNNIDGLVNFDRMAREGVKVPYMNATFSTVTFPNHYSIATGTCVTMAFPCSF